MSFDNQDFNQPFNPFDQGAFQQEPYTPQAQPQPYAPDAYAQPYAATSINTTPQQPYATAMPTTATVQAQQDDDYLDLDAPMVAEEKEFPLIPPGRATYKILEVNNESFMKDGKALRVMSFTLECVGADGTKGRVWERVFVSTKSSWRFKQILESIGMLEVGGAPVPPSALLQSVGRTGVLTLEHETYTTKSGETRTKEKVKSFLRPRKEASLPPASGMTTSQPDQGQATAQPAPGVQDPYNFSK